jgi:Tfp pilus assembly protein PilZ
MKFFSREMYCPLNGILVDMPTYIRSSDEDKRLLTDLVGVFPSLRLKCHDVSGEIRTLPFGTAYPGNIAPAFFVQNYCASFAQRRIRTIERSQLNLPALLSATLPMESPSGTKTVTVNISRGGCFLISFDPWNVGDRGWITLPDLQDSAPIPVEICWIRLWGKCRSLPGMGVRFIDLSASQKNELHRLGGQIFMQENE